VSTAFCTAILLSPVAPITWMPAIRCRSFHWEAMNDRNTSARRETIRPELFRSAFGIGSASFLRFATKILNGVKNFAQLFTAVDNLQK
jgi:hypothetical protein